MVRVRIAPSPTGNLHIGTARTALFNWLFAKKMNGEFILRIEDTDLERSEKRYEESIIESLKWLGLNWDGEIYHTTKRLDLHKKYLTNLLDSGKAFWCHHTKEELETEGKDQMSKKEAPRHLCGQKNKNLGEKQGAIIRLNVDTDSKIKKTFTDLVRGEIEWSENLLGDISLAKNLDTPLYNFYVVADDIEMKISHVIRGEDHISNTPKQILIYRALGSLASKLEAKLPTFAHLPLILGSDRSKLSKRHGATSITEFRKDYLPEALINFMGFLGYTYSKEILSKEEMAEELELGKVHKPGAIFDIKKLNWINSQYIKRLSSKELKRTMTNLGMLPNFNMDIFPDSALTLITERLEKLTDIQEFDYLLIKKPDYREKLKYSKDLLLKYLDQEKTKEILKSIKNQIEIRGIDAIKDILEELSTKHGGKGPIYWPFRVALTGKEKSPDPINISTILADIDILIKTSRGDIVRSRVGDAIEKLK